MKTSNHENFEDIVFESKPKEYGAYNLRKRYAAFLTRSMAISVGAFCLVFLVPFFLIKRGQSATKEEICIVIDSDLIRPKDDVLPPPPMPPPPISEVKKIIFRVPTVSTGDDIKDNEFGNMDEINKQLQIAPLFSDTTVIVPEKKHEEIKIIDDIEAPLPTSAIQEQPYFMGGEEEMYKFLKSKIVFPEEAKNNNIQGKVYVEFVIDRKGNISDARIIRSVHTLLDNEALRVINMMPAWEPGKQNGNPVKVRYVMPIKFTLAD